MGKQNKQVRQFTLVCCSDSDKNAKVRELLGKLVGRVEIRENYDAAPFLEEIGFATPALLAANKTPIGGGGIFGLDSIEGLTNDPSLQKIWGI